MFLWHFFPSNTIIFLLPLLLFFSFLPLHFFISPFIPSSFILSFSFYEISLPSTEYSYLFVFSPSPLSSLPSLSLPPSSLTFSSFFPFPSFYEIFPLSCIIFTCIFFLYLLFISFSLSLSRSLSPPFSLSHSLLFPSFNSP
jgi:hypothetical protein